MDIKTIKTEEIWEVDLDPDAEPTLFFASERMGPVCGFCDQILQNECELLQHAHSEHDISPDVFDGVDLRDAAAVQEAFLNVANLRNEFVSLGEVERCHQCGFLSTSANVFAAHKCLLAEPTKDPSVIVHPREPLPVPPPYQNPNNVLNENLRNAQRNIISTKINQVINSTAKPHLVNRIIKPLAKPQVELTVGNVIEMALVETVVNAGLKVRPPDVYDEHRAVEMVYSLCQTPQRYMAEQLRNIPADTCLQLLHLLRNRRVRVPAHETVSDLIKYSVEGNRNNNLIQRMPVPTVDCPNMPVLQQQLMLNDFRHMVAQSQLNVTQPHLIATQHKPIETNPKKKVVELRPKRPHVTNPPAMTMRTPSSPKSECPITQASTPAIMVITLDDFPEKTPPSIKSLKEECMTCVDCFRSFESKFTFVKHLQWQSFSQKNPIPLKCRFCSPLNRKSFFCEKGLKKHIYLYHTKEVNKDKNTHYSVDGSIHEIYKCLHCKRKRDFKSLAIMIHHLKVCCRKKNDCNICPDYVKNLRSPRKQKYPVVKKTATKSKNAKNVLKVVVPKTKGKIISSLERSFMIKEEIDHKLNKEDICIRPEFAFVAVKSDPSAQMMEEEISEISQLCMKSAQTFECVSCDLQELSPIRLRSHFLREHPHSIEEFQMSISRCGSVSARWVCPLCGNIFATEEAFLGHVGQHGVDRQDLLARVDDLRFLPTLRSTLFSLKTKK
ncbi:uncharacterized protein LOC135944574 [Cloeon dipterum]|uniref:uncharacterized protein LOC135944574 n=1 Tax=Cloeon dipterum TaxID=197152 RepID=UPI00321FF34D